VALPRFALVICPQCAEWRAMRLALWTECSADPALMPGDGAWWWFGVRPHSGNGRRVTVVQADGSVVPLETRAELEARRERERIAFYSFGGGGLGRPVRAVLDDGPGFRW
jgi:hypothetical protein